MDTIPVVELENLTREGFIVIPQAGQFYVANLTMGQLESQLYDRLGKVLAVCTSVTIVAAFRGPTPLPVPLDAVIDVRVLLFALMLSIATALLFGLAPAGRCRWRPQRLAAFDRRPSPVQAQ